MINASTFNEISDVIPSAEVCSQSMIERIDSSKPTAVVVGLAVSSLSFASAFSVGICAQKLLLSQVLSQLPIETLAASGTAGAAIFMVLTMKAGLQNRVFGALAYGSLGAFVLGILGGAVGI